MVDKILKQDEGITYNLFNAAEDPEEVPDEPVVDPEDPDAVPEKKEPVEKFPRHVLIEEVVEEPKIHFY